MSETNGYSLTATEQASNAVAKTDQQRAVAEVQAAMIIARMNPRDPVAALDRILNACQRKKLAETALYTYARGGSDITGPSIRLAEVLAQNWGNIQFGIRELDQRNGESTVQAYAWDVETNSRSEVTFQVPHIRHTKKGSYKLEDPRDIYEMVANVGARRLRARILAIIPGDIVDEAVAQCSVTLHAKADTSKENIQKLVETFAEYGVTKDQIEKRIQRRLDAIQAAQVVSLQKIYLSMRDGMSAPEDWFESEDADKPTTGVNGLKAALGVTPQNPPAPSQPTPTTFDRERAVQELNQIFKELGLNTSIQRSKAVESWSAGESTNTNDLFRAPDEILEMVLISAREELRIKRDNE
ncbi:hypothetical protein KJZ99_04220 [bacterium]|nr:hypothetical protein [bacterium]